MRPLNATARRAFRATCGHEVREGERCAKYRERALSSSQAAHAGTLYPWRTKCAACAQGQS